MRAKLILFTTCITLAHGALAFDYVKPLHNTKDFKGFAGWQSVLQRQPIVQGSGQITLKDLAHLNESYNHKHYKFTQNWQTPNEFDKSNTADCKGFAVRKYYALRALGVAADKLNLWVGDYVGESHIVLVVSLAGEDWLLDNTSAELVRPEDYFGHGFTPLYRINETGWSRY